MKYAFIETQRTQHPVRKMCRLLNVSAAGYYEWRCRLPSVRERSDGVMRNAIVRIHAASRKIYGRPRIHAALREEGARISPKRVHRLMKSANITGVSPRRFKKTTDSNHRLPIAPDRVSRAFNVAAVGGINRTWIGDITYVQTREGWLYLAVVLDLGSRRVVGWSMAKAIDTKLVVDAFLDAVGSRHPKPGLLFHSDRGSQYASSEYRALLDRHGVLQSMSRKGNCWDNAVAESFFGSLKSELGDPIWETREIARAKIFDYIAIWYNRLRTHSALGYLSPERYESQLPIAV